MTATVWLTEAPEGPVAPIITELVFHVSIRISSFATMEVNCTNPDLQDHTSQLYLQLHVSWAELIAVC